MVTIIKELGGNVRIEGLAQPVSMPSASTVQLSSDRGRISITSASVGVSFNVSDVVSTQILPAAPVVFTGDGLALFRTLSASFFFEPVAASEPGVEFFEFQKTDSTVSPSTSLFFSLPIENNSLAEIQVLFLTKKVGSNERYTNRYSARYQCDNTGTVTAFSASNSVAENLVTDVSLVPSVSPNLVTFSVTNLGAQTVDWNANVTWRKVNF